MTLPQFQIQFDAMADSAAVVRGPNVRFTVLTSRLIRAEHSPTEQLEDRPSQAFWYRRQPAPEFSARQEADRIEIETEHLLLRYLVSSQGFTPRSLSVHVKATGATWSYGQQPWRGGNLGGTARTLDGAHGAVRLEPGLMARDGWAMVDDSRSLVFNESCWLEPRGAAGNLDLYFFGYGRDYRACLQDFHKVSGRAPLIPRWALGNCWSRYSPYTQAELTALMQDFEAHQAPLSVCIVDMDWHITQTGNTSSGWTGYTWNRELFPDPSGFIARLHSKGLKTALNLHPADGVHPHEEQYEAMAAFMGVDPILQEPVPFDIADHRFMRGYFEILHHPHEAAGVDFWWIDWQQGAHSRLQGLDPLWFLNHLHFHDLTRDGRKRPFIFSRWGGLGNHRYPIGFSGDTIVSWESLAFQPGFTATAANVGYGWWSHDIGGHMFGIEDDELYARWVQFGVFSPILRLHSTANPYHDRRPWGRGLAAAHSATEAMRLRHALIPYLYSMAWRNHTESLPLITPMYYSHPKDAEAYQCPPQYWFGSELIAAPFTTPADSSVRLSRQMIWLPDGEWFNFFTGEYYAGGGWRAIYGDLDETPVFARAGAIAPLGPKVGWGGLQNPEALTVYVFPGADNRFELYEDDGETIDYQRGKRALTRFTQTWRGNALTFAIAPVEGDPALIPAQRAYQIVVRGVAQPETTALMVNGALRTPSWGYDEPTETLTLAPITLTPADELALSLSVSRHSLLSKGDRSLEAVRKLLRAFRLDTGRKLEIDRDWAQIQSSALSLRRYAGLTDAQIAALESIFTKS